jgi:hypothetical protein
MKTPAGLAAPFVIQWFAGATQVSEPGEACNAQIVDSLGACILETCAHDRFGFGVEEIERLTFFVEAANLMAQEPLKLYGPSPLYAGVESVRTLTTLEEGLAALRRGYPAMPCFTFDPAEVFKPREDNGRVHLTLRNTWDDERLLSE